MIAAPNAINGAAVHFEVSGRPSLFCEFARRFQHLVTKISNPNAQLSVSPFGVLGCPYRVSVSVSIRWHQYFRLPS